MKTVNIDNETASKMGIKILTGEACAISMRLLCELTPEMMQTYLSYTGIKVSILEVEKSSWNDKNSYAVFLTWETIEDLIIMTLLQSWNIVTEILVNDSECKNACVSGRKHLECYNSRDEFQTHVDSYNHLYTKHVWNEEKGSYDVTPGLYNIGRSYQVYNQQPHVGFSNVHAFARVAH
jgi:hypothetical protein